MQNLVLAVQNTVPAGELGIASSMATFFRTLGGAVGVSALGAVLAARVSQGLGGHGLPGGAIPDLSRAPAPARPLIEAAFGRGIGTVFLWCVPFALAALISIALIREVPLKTESGIERLKRVSA